MTFIQPLQLKEQIQLTEDEENFVEDTREYICAILNATVQQKLILLGPCSIHNYDEAITYALKVKALQEKVPNFLLVMRVYAEKPRTTVGWKGFVNDPDLDDTCDIEKGLTLTRKLCKEITQLGVPITTEVLDLSSIHYYDDYISLGSIGARNIESQPHRQYVSSAPFPFGLKNATNGDVMPAINAKVSASRKHVFLGVTEHGTLGKIASQGNPETAVVLRGGETPNYDMESVASALLKLTEQGVSQSIIIDCSHANSSKDYKKQGAVFSTVAQQMHFNPFVVGAMLESNLLAGSQRISDSLQYGVSITDSCIGWEETEKLILSAHEKM